MHVAQSAASELEKGAAPVFGARSKATVELNRRAAVINGASIFSELLLQREERLNEVEREFKTPSAELSLLPSYSSTFATLIAVVRSSRNPVTLP